jgi:hypothetical protein
MNKEKIIKIRVTDEERHLIFDRARSEGITISQLIRRQVLAEPVTDAIAASLKVKRDHIEAINAIGRNLNQLVRGYHASGFTNREELFAISDALKAIYDR